MKSGFFTRKSAHDSRAAKRLGGTRAVVQKADLRKLGLAGVREMNPRARHPEMAPTGADRPLVYILGDCPGEAEDRQGEPFVGPAGELLRESLPGWGVNEAVFDNVCRTRPPSGRKRRIPKPDELECFRDTIEHSIIDAKPKVILGLGDIALRWMFEDLKSVKAVRGRKFPVNIAGHRCWFLPTLHPSHLLRIAEIRDDKVPGKEWLRFWQQDLANAFDLAESGLQAEPVDPKTAMEGVEHCLTITDVRRAVDHLLAFKDVGFDGEMHRMRPYYKDSLFLTIAISDGDRTFSIPIDHPQSPWTKTERAILLDLLRKLLKGPRWVAHNIPHDYEWLVYLLGQEVHEAKFGCSLQAAFALNPGPPGHGAAGHRLEDLCLEHYGLDVKGLTPGARWVARLRELPLAKVLDYNALDAKWCLRLWWTLMKQVKAEGMMQSYKLQIARVPAVVNAQAMGVPVDQKIRSELEGDLLRQMKELEEKIASDSAVKKFVSIERKPFNPGSPVLVGKLLGSREHMDIAMVRVSAGKYTTSKKILEVIRGDVPIVDKLLTLRSLDKLLGTYVTRFDPKHKESYVFPDGKIHSRFGISRTRTARLNSEDPNSQNWPKRKNKHVRKQLAAPPGWTWVAVDQGQIEARGLAMESCDPTWVRMIHDNYDVHQEWAQKIATIDAPFAELLEKEPKQARHRAKNEWVFPAFYGSSLKSIIGNLKLENTKGAERLFKKFWSVFSGVKQWQKRQWQKYERDDHVVSLTGRRRWGPLSYNMAINTPIQSLASDICVDAMVRLFWRSRRENKPWLSAVLQIHDDLTFLVPDEDLEYSITAIVEEQLGFKADWLNVPLAVEVEIGQNLAEMTKVGSWSSSDLVLT